MSATYTDGTNVKAGDRIRYRQAPGGVLPPSRDWKHGVAAVFPPYQKPETAEIMRKFGMDPDELCLRTSEGRYFDIGGHEVERDGESR